MFILAKRNIIIHSPAPGVAPVVLKRMVCHRPRLGRGDGLF